MSGGFVYDASGVLEHRVNLMRQDRGLWHSRYDAWPVDAGVELAGATYSNGTPEHYGAFADRGDGAVQISVGGGSVFVQTYASTAAAAAELLEQLREEIPRAADSDPGLVPVTFWALSSTGPESRRRMIDAPPFDDIEGNYPAAGELLSLIHDWQPGAGGQLLLWHGDAGTGKTTALRSLGREWRDWAQLHYIVDPDKFFGESASYMLAVMMGGEEEIAKVGATERPTWRVLVLEDCAEMLAPDARRDVGQALSRLLNACDGLIGRGLRLLILITTNEPLEKVHPAVARPGRCAHRIEFDRFSAEQALEWLAGVPPPGRLTLPDSMRGSLTLADLYAIRDGQRSEHGRQPVGFAR